MLTCMTGVSSNNFAKKLEETAKKSNLDYSVLSCAVDDLKNNLIGIDVVLVGPQMKYKLDEIKHVVKDQCPIIEIDTLNFNILKCNEILNSIRENIR